MNASFLLNSGHHIPLIGCKLKFNFDISALSNETDFIGMFTFS